MDCLEHVDNGVDRAPIQVIDIEDNPVDGTSAIIRSFLGISEADCQRLEVLSDG